MFFETILSFEVLFAHPTFNLLLDFDEIFNQMFILTF